MPDVENHMARRVTRRVPDIQREIADRNRVAFDQPAIRLERNAGNAIVAPILIESRNPETICLMRAFNGHAKLIGQRLGLAAMINMAVGQDDLLHRHAMLRRRRLQPRKITARINKGTAHCRGAPDQGAVLLKRSDRHNRGTQGRVSHAQR